MKGYDYFHSDDPVEAAKFVVSAAVARACSVWCFRWIGGLVARESPGIG
jgi:hypothetical protein